MSDTFSQCVHHPYEYNFSQCVITLLIFGHSLCPTISEIKLKGFDEIKFHVIFP